MIFSDHKATGLDINNPSLKHKKYLNWKLRTQIAWGLKMNFKLQLQILEINNKKEHKENYSQEESLEH